MILQICQLQLPLPFINAVCDCVNFTSSPHIWWFMCNTKVSWVYRKLSGFMPWNVDITTKCFMGVGTIAMEQLEIEDCPVTCRAGWPSVKKAIFNECINPGFRPWIMGYNRAYNSIEIKIESSWQSTEYVVKTFTKIGFYCTVRSYVDWSQIACFISTLGRVTTSKAWPTGLINLNTSTIRPSAVKLVKLSTCIKWGR